MKVHLFNVTMPWTTKPLKLYNLSINCPIGMIGILSYLRMNQRINPLPRFPTSLNSTYWHERIFELRQLLIGDQVFFEMKIFLDWRRKYYNTVFRSRWNECICCEEIKKPETKYPQCLTLLILIIRQVNHFKVRHKNVVSKIAGESFSLHQSDVSNRQTKSCPIFTLSLATMKYVTQTNRNFL